VNANALSRSELLSLERYAVERAAFRARVLAHKQNRSVALGGHLTLLFEDRLTIQYQIQEMLRIERIFEPEAIQDELDAYNPLVPDGSNWKATMLIEYADIEERRTALAQMIGIEDRVWMRVDGFERVYAIADEDMERENAEKTSSVHFLRFQLSPDMVRAAKAGAELATGVDHPAYDHTLDPLPVAVVQSLVADLS
jgi:hypothetical protein